MPIEIRSNEMSLARRIGGFDLARSPFARRLACDHDLCVFQQRAALELHVFDRDHVLGHGEIVSRLRLAESSLRIEKLLQTDWQPCFPIGFQSVKGVLGSKVSIQTRFGQSIRSIGFSDDAQ